MADWQRRSVLKTGAALSTGGLIASIGATAAESGENETVLEEPRGWSSYGGNAGNTRFVPSDGGFENPETIAWQYDENGSAAAVDGMIYLQTNGEVHALDAEDGRCLWKCDGIGAARTPTVAADTVYVTGDGLTAIEADSGDVRWQRTFGDGASTSSPVTAFGTVYIAVEGELYALDAADGSRRWTRQSVTVNGTRSRDEAAGRATEFNTRANAIAAADGIVWALLDDRRSAGSTDADAVAAIDPTTGEEQWAARLSPGTFATGLAAADDALFIEDPNNEEVSVFDLESRENGRVIWDALTTATTGGRTVTRGRHGLEMRNTSSVWSKNGNYAYGAPAIVGETVVVAHSENGTSTDDDLVGFDLESGDEQWRFTFDEPQWTDAFGVDCLVDRGTVYVERNEGLTALRAGTPTATESDT